MAQREKIIFPVIYMLHYRPSSGCEFFRVLEREGYFIGWCRVLERALVKDSVVKCERFWLACPFRKTGLQLRS